jgi:hypothetical protein
MAYERDPRLAAALAEAQKLTGGRPLAATRRVVTGNNAAGRSYVVSDAVVEASPLWTAEPSRPLGDMAAGEAPGLLASTAGHIDPAPGGSAVTVAPIMPWRIMRPLFEAGAVPGHDAGGFHRTATIDYVMVLNGSLELVLDEGAVQLAAGDLVIQRNTLHSWRNHGEDIVRIVASIVRA